MIISELIEQMAAAGAPIDAILIAVRALEARDAEIEAKRAVERDRKRRQRERDSHGTVTGQSRDTPPFPSPPNENNLTPPAHTPVCKSRAREDFPILGCTTPEIWADFLKNRKAKRLPCTETAHRRLLRDLERWVLETGWPPGRVFETCVAKGWGAIYDPRDKVNGNANRNCDSKTGLGRTFDAGQRVLERIQAMQANMPPGSDASIFDP